MNNLNNFLVDVGGVGLDMGFDPDVAFGTIVGTRESQINKLDELALLEIVLPSVEPSVERAGNSVWLYRTASMYWTYLLQYIARVDRI